MMRGQTPTLIFKQLDGGNRMHFLDRETDHVIHYSFSYNFFEYQTGVNGVYMLSARSSAGLAKVTLYNIDISLTPI